MSTILEDASREEAYRVYKAKYIAHQRLRNELKQREAEFENQTADLRRDERQARDEFDVVDGYLRGRNIAHYSEHEEPFGPGLSIRRNHVLDYDSEEIRVRILVEDDETLNEFLTLDKKAFEAWAKDVENVLAYDLPVTQATSVTSVVSAAQIIAAVDLEES